MISKFSLSALGTEGLRPIRPTHLRNEKESSDEKEEDDKELNRYVISRLICKLLNDYSEGPDFVKEDHNFKTLESLTEDDWSDILKKIEKELKDKYDTDIKIDVEYNWIKKDGREIKAFVDKVWDLVGGEDTSDDEPEDEEEKSEERYVCRNAKSKKDDDSDDEDEEPDPEDESDDDNGDVDSDDTDDSDEDDNSNEPPTPPKKKRDNTSKKKLKKRKKEGKKKTVTVSTTDPDCGLFVKGDHKKQLAYEAHTACDVHGVVLAVEVTPGNVHDSVPFDDVYDKVVEKFPDVHAFVADSAYKTPHICKKVFSDNRVLSTAYKRPQTKSGHEWWQYVYDEHFDCIICPEYQVLNYSTTNRDGYREYKSDPKVCANCPTRHLCTKNKDCIKTVTRHIWKEYEEMADDARYTPIYKRMYKARKETIERVFADAKEKHGMRYTRYTGLAQVTNWVKLAFAAMNLKKFANWHWKDTHSSYISFIISIISTKYILIPCLA